MKIKYKVMTKDGSSYVFAATVHGQSDPRLFHLDRSFYGEWPETFSGGVHHELELTEPDQDFFLFHPSDTRRSSVNGKYFVAHPKPLPSLASAEILFELWCLVTVYRIEAGIDLDAIRTGEYLDRSALARLLRDKHDIFITSRISVPDRADSTA